MGLTECLLVAGQQCRDDEADGDGGPTMVLVEQGVVDVEARMMVVVSERV